MKICFQIKSVKATKLHSREKKKEATHDPTWLS